MKSLTRRRRVSSFRLPTRLTGRSTGQRRKGRRKVRQHLIEQLEDRRLLAVASLPSQLLSVAEPAVYLAPGNYNADGLSDLASVSRSGVIDVALNGGSNDWQTLRTSRPTVDTVFGGASTLFNSDLFEDLLLQSSTSLTVLQSDGDGGWLSKHSIEYSGVVDVDAHPQVQPAIGLFGDDVFIDFVAPLPQVGELAIFLGNENGFAAPTYVNAGDAEPIAVAIADVIGGPQADIVVGHRSGRLSFLEGTPDGSFVLRDDLTIPATVGAIVAIEARDLDRDGRSELIVAGDSGAAVLSPGVESLPVSPIINGHFESGLTGWTVESLGQPSDSQAGRVTASSGLAHFSENQAFLTSLSQSFAIPENPELIEFDLLALGLDSLSDGQIPDAFEVSLLDENSSSLVATHRPESTAFVNFVSGEAISTSTDVSLSSTKVSLDISAIPVGTEATLIFDLIGNPQNGQSSATIDNVTITPIGVRNETFSIATLAGPFATPQDLATGDVDGDGLMDIVVSDSGLSAIVVFNANVAGGFTREPIDVSEAGAPTYIAVGPLTQPDAILDISAGLLGENSLLSPLNSDRESPSVILTAPDTLLELETLESAEAALGTISLAFSEAMVADSSTSPGSASNPNSYRLYNYGPDGRDDSGTGDDISFSVASATYDSPSHRVTLSIDALELVDPERAAGSLYRIVALGTDPAEGLRDLAGNRLGNGQDASFVVNLNRQLQLEPLADFSIDEGSQVDIESDLYNYNFNKSYIAIVDWGDGSTTELPSISGVSISPLRSSHTYADNGQYQVSLTIRDIDGGTLGSVRASQSSTVTVRNVAPTITASDVSVGAGELFTISTVQFTDPGFSQNASVEGFTATVDWGDGTGVLAADIVDLVNGSPDVPSQAAVRASHTFQNSGVFEVVVTVSDDDGGMSTSSFVANVESSGTLDRWLPAIDFDHDGLGSPLVSGERVAEQWAAWGVHISSHDPVNHPPMLFNSDAPTGDDADLGSPNQDFGGPGVGSGGARGSSAANSQALRNVLILSEDNDSLDPDDSAQGGTLIFAFDDVVMIDDVQLLDIDDSETATLNAYGEDGELIVSRTIAGIGGGNGVQTVAVNARGVRRLEVDLSGSGAVTEVVFCRDLVDGLVRVAGPASVLEGASYSLELDSTGQTVDYWVVNWGDGHVQQIAGDLALANHVFEDGYQTYEVKAFAYNEAGVLSANAHFVAVENVIPGLKISGAATVEAGSLYTLDLASEDPGLDTILGWLVDWGDDTTPHYVAGNPNAVQHRYARDGTYEIRAHAFDEDYDGPRYAAASGSLLTILARGSEGGETFDLLVEDAVVASFVADLAIESFVYASPSPLAPNQIKIRFTGDNYDPSQSIDANLFVDRIEIDGRSFETEASDVYSTGTWHRDDGIKPGYRMSEWLHADGYFHYDHDANDGTRVIVRARGAEGVEQFNLVVDGQIVGAYTTTASFKEYEYRSSEIVSADQVRVEFTNDRWDPSAGIDNNLQVDFIELNGKKFETEHPSVFSTGTWKAEDGIQPGYRQSEWLHANGYFQFADCYFGESQPNSCSEPGDPFATDWVSNKVEVLVTASPDLWLPTIDFERAANGGSLTRGERISHQFLSLGLTIASSNPHKPPMIFNTAIPTGGDRDLGTPNSHFGGPGLGVGGQAGVGVNQLPLRNVLIISEDNDASDPDDNAAGGTLIFRFENTVMMDEVHLLDIDTDGTHVRVFASDGTLISDTPVENFGENSFQIVRLNATGVARMEIVFDGSGAVAAVVSCRDNGPIAPPLTRFFVVDREDATFRYAPNGQSVGEFALASDSNSRGAATTGEGNPLWVVSEEGSTDRVYVVDTNTETQLGAWSAKGVVKPQGIATDGKDVWIVDDKSNRVYRYADAASRRSGYQNRDDYFKLRNGNKNPKGITTDGQHIWVVDSGSDKVFVYDMDGNWVNWWNLDPANSDPTGLTINPGHDGLWVVDAKDQVVYAYAKATLSDQGAQHALSTFALAAGNSNPQGIADPAVMINLDQVVSDTIASGTVDEWSFTVAAGQQVYVDFTALSNGPMTSELIDPSGSVIYSVFGFSRNNHDRGPLTLNVTGDYTLRLSGKGNYTFVIVDIPEPRFIDYTLGTLISETTGARFGTDNYAFAGSSGQEVFLKWNSISAGAAVRLLASDGTVIASGSGASATNLELRWITLPADDVYTLSVTSSSNLSYSFLLADVPANREFTAALDAPVAGTLESIGGRDIWLFDAVAGQSYFFDMHSISGGWLNSTLTAPDGTLIRQRLDPVADNHDFGALDFPQTGQYQLELKDDRGGVPSYEFTIRSVPAPDTRTIDLGQLAAGAIESPGAVDIWNFELEAGQLFNIDMNISTGGVNLASKTLIAPDGTTVFTQTHLPPQNNPRFAPQKGTYSLIIDGLGDDAFEYSIAVGAARNISIDTPISGIVATPLQSALYEFDAAAGDPLTLNLMFRDGQAFELFTPSRSSLFNNQTEDRTVASLPETGRYSLLVTGIRGPHNFMLQNATVPSDPSSSDLNASSVQADLITEGNGIFVDVTWQVDNLNSTASSEQWTDTIVFSSDAIIGDADDVVVGSFDRNNGLSAFGSYQRTERVALPTDFSGDFFVAVHVDAFNSNFEGADENNNMVRTNGRISRYQTPPNAVGAVELSIADQRRFPTGTSLPLSGRALPSGGSVNVVFAIDVSGSTNGGGPRDANFDGVVNDLDDINSDGELGNILDAELGAILHIGDLLAATGSANLAVAPFAATSAAIDLSSATYNQSFADPSALNDLGQAEFRKSVTSIRVSSVTDFNEIDFGAGTNFSQSLAAIDDLLDRAPAAERTYVYFLTDGAAATPPQALIDAVASKGVVFQGVQISGASVSGALQAISDGIDANAVSTGSATVIADPSDLIPALIDEFEISQVTVNGSAISNIDAAGNFFFPVSLISGANQFDITATNVAGGVSRTSVTLYGDDPGNPINLTQLGETSESLVPLFEGTTFNRQTRELSVSLRIANTGDGDIAQPIVAVFDSIDPVSITLSSADGRTDRDKPYFAFSSEPSSTLVAGTQTEPRQIHFENPAAHRFELGVELLVAQNAAPVFLSTPPLTAIPESVYSYAVGALDTNGDALQFKLLEAPPAMLLSKLDQASALIQWTPTSSDVGYHNLRIEVSDDRGGVAEQRFALLAPDAIANSAPLILSSPPTFATVGESYAYFISARDPDADPVSITLEGTLPEGLTLTGTTLGGTPTSNAVGTYPITILARDSAGAVGRQSFDLIVLGSNTPPEFVTNPVGIAYAGLDYRYAARAADAEDRVTYSLVRGPSGLSIDPINGLVRWQPSSSDLGTNPSVTLQATDPQGLYADQTYALIVAPDTIAPSVSVILANTLVNQGQSVALRVYASDNVNVSDISLTADGQPLSLDANNRANFTTTQAGIVNFEVTASDDAGNVGFASAQLRVIDPNDTTPPVVAITSPAIGDVVTYLSDIVGSVMADDLEFYTVEYSLAGAKEFTQVFRSNVAVDNGVLATFDPTLLANDLYEIRVSAQDTNGNIRRESIEVALEGQAKLGNYRLAVTDLNVPLAGIPIQINRIYDTLDAPFNQDFGFGWSLGIASPRIRESVPVSEAEANGSGMFGANPFQIGTRVYMTAPDGRRVGFTFEPVPQTGLLGTIWRPRFVADPGVYERLEVADVNLSQNEDGTFGVYVVGLPYNPDAYSLVTKDQMRYSYGQFGGSQLKTIVDRNGVELEYREDGIFSSTGDSITWTRDALGRITTITAPNGERLLYSYDSAGNLQRFTNQVADTWSMEYSEQSSHFLTKVKGPRGNTLNEVLYDENGRFIGLVDALGNLTQQSYDTLENSYVQTDPVGNTTQFTYDNLGNITRVVDANGNVSTAHFDDPANPYSETMVRDARGVPTLMAYDSSGNLTNVVETNRTTVIQYNERNDIIRVDGPVPTDPDPEYEPTFVAMSYDANGNLASFTNANGETERFVNDAFGRIVEVKDANDKLMQLEYGGFKDPDLIRYPDGAQRSASRNSMGLIVAATNEVGMTTQFSYDSVGRPLTITDPLGNVYENRYQNDLLIESLDPLGRATRFEYDGRNRITKVVDPLGGATLRSYNPNGRVASVTNQLGQSESWAYNSIGDLASYTDTAGRTTIYEYDEVSNLISVEDARGYITNFTYDDQNRLTTIVDAVGGVQQFTYDERDYLATTIDPNGGVTATTYDSVGRLLATQDALGNQQSWSYDAVGNNIAYTDQRGNVTTTEYNDRSRPVRIRDAAGFDQQWQYDPAGRMSAYTDQEGNQWIYAYDGNNQLVSITDPLLGVASSAYDDVGNRVAWTDELGRSTTREYDVLDRVISEMDASGELTQFDYDAIGNLLSLTDPLGNRTRYSYNAANEMVSRTDPLANVATFEYDALSNITRTVDRLGRITDYAYDGLSRLISEVWKSPNETVLQTISYAFDANSNLLEASGPSSVHTFSYDPLDRVASASDASLGIPQAVFNYAYDPAGNLTQVSDASGVAVDSVYDNRNLLTSLSWSGPGVDDVLVDYSRDGRGLVVDAYRYSDLGGENLVARTNRTFDVLGRLTQLSHLASSATVIADYQFAFDAASQLTRQVINSNVSDYSFDALGQLTGSQNSGRADEAYAYDAGGNRIAGDIVVGSNNQLLSDGTFDYQYDAEGNLIRKTDKLTGGYSIYQFDHRNRLVEAATYSAGASQLSASNFVYDVFDRLISHGYDLDGSGPAAIETTYTIYEGENAWADFDAAGTVIARYFFGQGIDSNIARWRPDEGTAWYLTDHLGSVRDIIDGAGTVIDHLEYDSFGNILVESDAAAGDRYKFTGREWFEELGLYYYRARFYDPTTGDFISQDPLGFASGDNNLQRYVGNSPLTLVDPTGNLATVSTASAYQFSRIGVALAAGISGATFGYTCGYLNAVTVQGLEGDAANFHAQRLGLLVGSVDFSAGITLGGSGGTLGKFFGAALFASGALALGTASNLATGTQSASNPAGQIIDGACFALSATGGYTVGRFAGGLGRQLITDIRSGARLSGHQLSSQLNQIWGPEPLAVLLSNISNASRVGYLIRGSERILQRHVATIAAANPGISSRSLGILAGRAAEKDILRYASRLGLKAVNQHRLQLPADLLALSDEGLASYRIADIALPNQSLVLELTLESGQDLWQLSMHKQGQLADFYISGFRTVIITPH